MAVFAGHVRSIVGTPAQVVTLIIARIAVGVVINVQLTALGGGIYSAIVTDDGTGASGQNVSTFSGTPAAVATAVEAAFKVPGSFTAIAAGTLTALADTFVTGIMVWI